MTSSGVHFNFIYLSYLDDQDSFCKVHHVILSRLYIRNMLVCTSHYMLVFWVCFLSKLSMFNVHITMIIFGISLKSMLVPFDVSPMLLLLAVLYVLHTSGLYDNTWYELLCMLIYIS
jgi:hypothetical protein